MDSHKLDKLNANIVDNNKLCPNCHEKKTKGVIKVDFERKLVTENNQPIKIRDNHLFN